MRGLGSYTVSIDQWQGHRAHDEERSRSLARPADIVFCEWCLGNALWYSERKTDHQRLFIRLHRQEFYGRAKGEFLSRVDWDVVDAAIVIAPYYKGLLTELTDLDPNDVHFIPNLFDTGRFARRKSAGVRHNLGLVKYTRRKRPDLAFQILTRLAESDSRFSLHIIGKKPEEIPWLWKRPEERLPVHQFLESVRQSELRDSVVIHPYTEDMPSWFSNIGFVLSTSDSEGSHQAVAEGMAAGCVPVIRDWPGADQLYPRRFVFSTIDEAVQLVSAACEPDRFHHLSQLAQRWAHARFDTHKVAAQLLALLERDGR